MQFFLNLFQLVTKQKVFFFEFPYINSKFHVKYFFLFYLHIFFANNLTYFVFITWLLSDILFFNISTYHVTFYKKKMLHKISVYRYRYEQIRFLLIKNCLILHFLKHFWLFINTFFENSENCRIFSLKNMD